MEEEWGRKETKPSPRTIGNECVRKSAAKGSHPPTLLSLSVSLCLSLSLSVSPTACIIPPHTKPTYFVLLILSSAHHPPPFRPSKAGSNLKLMSHLMSRTNIKLDPGSALQHWHKVKLHETQFVRHSSTPALLFNIGIRSNLCEI